MESGLAPVTFKRRVEHDKVNIGNIYNISRDIE